MARRLRCHDWERTPLGPVESWPDSLRTLVAVMTNASQPMFIVWGSERTLLYNDGYAEILAAKHPDALGRDFLEVWSEVRDDLLPIVEEAYGGRPVFMDDIALQMQRREFEGGLSRKPTSASAILPSWATDALEELGAVVVGPFATAEEALATVRSPDPLDGATLDMTLGREKSYDVARALLKRGVPFVILSGYGERGLPEDLRTVPRCDKPFDIRKLVTALFP